MGHNDSCARLDARQAGGETPDRRPCDLCAPAVADGFKLAGFLDIVFLGDHGGYQKDEKAVADRVDKQWAATPVRAHESLYRL